MNTAIGGSSNDALKVAGLFLGKLLGQGVARRVYEYRPRPYDYVVKVQAISEDNAHDYQNIAEWSLWCAATDRLRQWLAPCYCLSPDGMALLQARCEPCPEHLIPKRAPKIFGDLHQRNFGVFEKRVVVTDYGRNIALDLMANAKTMRKVYFDGPTPEVSSVYDGA